MTTSNSTQTLDLESVPRFLNRELTWLRFNRRVLHEAIDERTPLLERVRFLGIFTSNLDEFFMKRVGGLKRQVLANVVTLSIDGLTASQQLSAIRDEVADQLNLQAECFTGSIRPALSQNGVDLLPLDTLSDTDQQYARHYFQQSVYPVLTPMAVDPGHPFPLLSNLSMNLGVRLSYPGSDEHLFARVKVPQMIPRWLRLPEDDSGRFRFVSMIDVIAEHLGELFEGMEIQSVTPFRVTRNADVERDEEDAEDLLELIEQELRERRFAHMVRLEHNPGADPWSIQFLMRELQLSDEDVYELPAELDFTGLKPIADLELPQLKFSPWSPIIPPRLADEDADIFSVVRTGDLLVHHPYESFNDSVERFIRQAAVDPKVVAIKLTLYRIGESRSLVNTLIQSAEAGKQVICLVELKARFDEQRNIRWAQELERAGVHVFYGVVGLKTHTKLTLVVREDSDGLRCYCHVGTGNYNLQTARLYDDLGLLTCDTRLTNEVVQLFHYLTGRSIKSDYEHMLVGPVNMRRKFMALIDQEVENAQTGKPAHIVAKMNSLEDRKIILALYRASQAGVPIDLIVRGFCCLRPGVPGLSESIRVMSVIGRFLEHSRIFYFRNGQDKPEEGQFFIGSADWMYRNLAHRVEVVSPVWESKLRARLWQILDVLMRDQRQAWDMDSEGNYTQRTPEDPARQIGTHQRLMQMARHAASLSITPHE